MGALKTLLKLMFVLVLAACIAGVVMVVKRPSDGESTGDEWPDVPRSPTAE